MNSKNSTQFIYSGLGVILLGALIVFVNVITTNLFYRADVTEDKRYSITDASKRIVSELDDKVSVNVYFSRTLPPDLELVEQQVADMLSEYDVYGGANFDYVFVDPADSEKLTKEAEEYGVPQLQMNIFDNDQLQVINGYLGMVLLYGANKETIPVVNDITSLEYDISSAIVKLRDDEPKTLGFLIGHNEHTIGQFVGLGSVDELREDYKKIREILEKSYTVRSVNLSVIGAQLEGVDTLIIPGPTEEFTQRDLFEIDQFIMQGGNVIVLMDQAEIHEGLAAVQTNTRLDDFLKHFGVTVTKTIVADENSEKALFSQGDVQFIVTYPYWVRAGIQQLSREHPITSPLESVVFPWPHELEIDEDSGFEALAWTTDAAWVETPPYKIKPQESYDINDEDRKQRILAAIKGGNFDSYFADAESIPPIQTKNEEGEFQDLPGSIPSDRDIIQSSAEQGTLTVMSTSRIATDDLLQRWAFNSQFFANTVDFVTLGNDLIEVRSKQIADRPIKELTITQKNLYKALAIGAAPILLTLYGVVRFIRRRKFHQRITRLISH